MEKIKNTELNPATMQLKNTGWDVNLQQQPQSTISNNQSIISNTSITITDKKIQSRPTSEEIQSRPTSEETPCTQETNIPKVFLQGRVLFQVGQRETNKITQWQPSQPLQYGRTPHPLSSPWNSKAEQVIRDYCRLPSNMIIGYHRDKSEWSVDVKSLRGLISPIGHMSKNIMAICISITCHRRDIPSLNPDFYTTLSKEGWGETWPHFAANRKGRYRSLTRPWKTNESSVIIPCLVSENHWVAVIRREISNRVSFFYSDHLNCPSIIIKIRNLFQQDKTFHPPTATWTNCLSHYYNHDAPDCGPIALLALLVMSTHPNLAQNILMPYMHPNITQICRYWAATTLMFDHNNLPLLSTSPNAKITNLEQRALLSQIDWSIPTDMSKDFIQVASVLDCFSPQNIQSYSHNMATPLDDSTKLVEVPGSSYSPHTQKTVDDSRLKVTPLHKSNKEVLSQASHTMTPNKGIKGKLPTGLRKVTQHTLHHYLTEKNTGSNCLTQNPTKTDKTFGHALLTIDSTTTLRFILQNPNGFNIQENPDDFVQFLQTTAALRAGLIGIVETNINWNQPSHLRLAHSITKRHFSTSALVPSTHPTTFLSPVQPGGTLSILTERWVSRLITKGQDPYGLGRWSYFSLRRNDNKEVVIISVYRACNASISAIGDKTAAAQQYRSIIQKSNASKSTKIPHPHRQCMLDLQAWITILQKKGSYVIVIMDNNEDILQHQGSYSPLENIETSLIRALTHNASLATLLLSCNLVVTLAHQHTPPYPATYIRGKKRLDYILISAELVPAIQRTGILPFHQLCLGDHRACYLDLNATILFGSTTHTIVQPIYRQLRLGNPAIVTAYKSTLTKQLTYHKVKDKLLLLTEATTNGTWNHELQVVYEKLDRTITEAMLHAEATSSPPIKKTYEWSPAQSQSTYEIKYWTL
jgi:hypothetical protein